MNTPDNEAEVASHELFRKGDSLRNKHVDETCPIEEVDGHDAIIRLRNGELIRISETQIEQHWEVLKPNESDSPARPVQ